MPKPERDGWHYHDNPPAGKDARKIVTLDDEHGFTWVGIRIWNTQLSGWFNNNEPERSKVIAWRDLPERARGYFSRGQFFIPKEPSQ